MLFWSGLIPQRVLLVGIEFYFLGLKAEFSLSLKVKVMASYNRGLEKAYARGQTSGKLDLTGRGLREVPPEVCVLGEQNFAGSRWARYSERSADCTRRGGWV